MALKLTSLFLVILLLPIIATSFNFNYPAVFNFGDSNSDTGGLVAGVAFPVGRPNGDTYFHKPSGRFCDGRVILDFLMDAMSLPFLNPYLESVGAPRFRWGTNFATGGATILSAKPNARNPFSFDIQVAQFVRFKSRVLELLAQGKKYEKYLPTEEYFEQGLYMFDIGQNDLDGSFYLKSEAQVIDLIPTLLSNFSTGIKKIYDQGARNFWIHNTSPLGCLPRIITINGTKQSSLDEHGCVAAHNRAANVFNSQLHDLCTKFQDQFPEANVTYVDVFSIKLNLISNFSQYGFKQPIEACCGYGGPPLNFDNRVACGVTVNLNGTIATANPCNDTTEFVNWDGNHYTDAANQFISREILSGNYSYRLVSANVSLTVESQVS
ncbi:hypothetical protein ACFE04_031785 [Oxalis oulophora]